MNSEDRNQILEVILMFVAALQGLTKLQEHWHKKPTKPQIQQVQPVEQKPVRNDGLRRLPPVEPEFTIPVTPFNPRGW